MPSRHLLLLVCLLLPASPLLAQSTWTGNALVGPERWNRPGNWANLLPPILPIQDALFSDIPGNTNVDIRAFGGGSTTVVPGTLFFTNNTDAYTITIIAGSELRPQTLQLDGSGDVTITGPGLFRSQILAANTLTLTGSGSSLLTINAAISDGLLGNDTILDHNRSSGTTILNAPSSFTGGTNLLAGTLLLGDDSALGTGPLAISANTTLGTAGSDVQLTIPISILGDFSVRSGSGDLELAGLIDLGPDTRTVTLAEDGSFFCFAGELTGDAGLTLLLDPGASFATVILCGPDANSFTGPLIIGNGIQAQLQKDTGLRAVNGDILIQLGGALSLFDDLAQINPASSITVEGILALFHLGLGGSDTASFAQINGSGTITNIATAATLQIGSGTFSGSISDSGISGGELSLRKTGPGTLTLTGNNTYLGTTQVDGGTLTINGSLASPSVTIGPGATLSGSGTLLGNVNVLPGGILSPGTSPGILTVGTLTLSPGSLTLFEINGLNPGTQHDQIQVTGNASLDGTAQILFGGGFTPADGDTFTLLQATSITGQFSAFTSNLGPIFTLELAYNPTTLNLIVTLFRQDYALFATNENQLNVATNLDSFVRSGQMPELIALLDSLDRPSLAAAFQQISPESLGALDRLSRLYNRAQSRNLFNRLAEWRTSQGGIAGTVSTSNLRFLDWTAQPLQATTQLRQVTPVSLDTVRNPTWSLFASGTGQFGEIAGDGNGTGFDFATGGMTLGADRHLGTLLDGRLIGGLYAGYAGSQADLDTNRGRVEANGGKLGLYGSWINQGLYSNLHVGGGLTSYDTRRNVLGQRQTGSTTGYEFVSDFALGHEWSVAGWRLGPEAALAYHFNAIDRFTESGGLAPLTLLDQNIHSLQTRLGLRASYEYLGNDGWWLRPALALNWAREHLDTASAIDARLASGAGGIFRAMPTRLGRDTALASASLTLGQNLSWNAWIAYEVEAGHNLLSHTLNAGAAFSF
ncbi:MAG: autotransporter domain-containing protein [Verrucomicrobiia bacterium]